MLNLIKIIFLSLSLFISSCEKDISKNIANLTIDQKIQKCEEFYQKAVEDEFKLSFELKKWNPYLDECKNLAENGNADAQYWMGMIGQFSTDKDGNPSYKNNVLFFLFIANLNKHEEAQKEFNRLIKIYDKRDIAGFYLSMSNLYKKNPKELSLKEVNYKKSWEMEKKAASYGNILSYMGLGNAYASGSHYSYKVAKYFPESYKWFFLAKNDYGSYHDGHGTDIKQNQETAQKILDKLESFMTKTQIEEAKIRTKKWLKENPDFVPDMNEALKKAENIKFKNTTK